MYDYDRRSSTTKTAGQSFGGHLKRMEDGLGKVQREANGAYGLIHYRLYDSSGRMKDRFTGEPVLDEAQRRKATKVLKDLEALKEALAAVRGKMQTFERETRWLDDNLDYV